MSTAVLELNPADGAREPEPSTAPAAVRPGGRGGRVLVAALALCCAVATSINLAGYPIRFGDEGVYVAQAWAIPNLHALAHYTYWYDHPPLGWVQMSIWFELTRGLQRWSADTTVAGREFMVVARIATCVLMYALARRLGMRRGWAAAAVLLLIFSPLAMYYDRMVLLDNIAMPWLLASFLLAASPRRTWSAAVGSAVCFAMTVCTKETLAVAAPALAYAIWSNYRGASNRQYVWVSFAVVLTMTVSLYPLYAILKNELIPGPGHVSLVEAIRWQLGARKGSGSVFDPASDAHRTVANWLRLDPLLPVGGALAALPLLRDGRYRPILIALLCQLAMLLRTGYLPFMYITTLLPLMALAVAGLGDRVWPREWPSRGSELGTRVGASALAGVLLVAAGSTAAAQRAGEWPRTLDQQWTTDADRPERDLVAWLGANVPHDAVLVSEGELWLDLHDAGFTGPGNVWVYKVDSDPGIANRLGSWTAIDYLALSRATLGSQSSATMPWVFTAVSHADVIATFGTGDDKVTVLKVRK